MLNFVRVRLTGAAALATALFSPFGVMTSGGGQAISVVSVAMTSYTFARQVSDLFAPVVSVIRGSLSATEVANDAARPTATAIAAPVRFYSSAAREAFCFDWRPWSDGDADDRWPKIMKAAVISFL